MASPRFATCLVLPVALLTAPLMGCGDGPDLRRLNFGATALVTGDFDTVERAMGTCPVNCIELVGWEDLVKLEMERQGGQIDTNSYWVKLEGMLYYNADTLAKENKRTANRLRDLATSWAEKKKQTDFE